MAAAGCRWLPWSACWPISAWTSRRCVRRSQGSSAGAFCGPPGTGERRATSCPTTRSPSSARAIPGSPPSPRGARRRLAAGCFLGPRVAASAPARAPVRACPAWVRHGRARRVDHAAHPEDTTAEVLRRLDLDSYADLFRADHLAFGDLTDKIRRWWDLDELDRQYREIRLRARARAVPPEAHPGPSGLDGPRPVAQAQDTDRDAFADYMRALTDWRRLPYLDPGLPDELLPPDWPAPARPTCSSRCTRCWRPRREPTSGRSQAELGDGQQARGVGDQHRVDRVLADPVLDQERDEHAAEVPVAVLAMGAGVEQTCRRSGPVTARSGWRSPPRRERPAGWRGSGPTG